MSWLASFAKAVAKENVEVEIDSLRPSPPVIEGPGADQVKLAKRAAKELCKGIPGPFIAVSLNGHANGVGWQKKEGWANDYISLSVTQVTDAPP